MPYVPSKVGAVAVNWRSELPETSLSVVLAEAEGKDFWSCLLCQVCCVVCVLIDGGFYGFCQFAANSTEKKTDASIGMLIVVRYPAVLSAA